MESIDENAPSPVSPADSEGFRLLYRHASHARTSIECTAWTNVSPYRFAKAVGFYIPLDPTTVGGRDHLDFFHTSTTDRIQ